jgi:hypothetical protein
MCRCRLQTNHNTVVFLCPSSWDEWVAETRILKYTDANLQKQKELKQQQLYEAFSQNGMISVCD